MNKLKTFFKTFIKSLTEPAYYNHILKAKFAFSVKYFLMFYLVLGLITSTIYNFDTKPELANFAKDIVQEVASNYPDDLVITVSNSGLTMEGAQDPLNIPLPSFFQDSDIENDFEYLATITQDSQIPKTSALIIATKDQVLVSGSNGRKEAFTFDQLELEEDEVLTLDQNLVADSSTKLQSLLATIIGYSPILVFIASISFIPAFTAIGLLFNSLFTWLIASLFSKNLTYKQSYQIGLHTSTFASTAVLIKNLLFPAVTLGAFSTIAFLGSTIIALLAIKPLSKKS